MPPKAPKRTSSQAYSHSPPPLPQQLPQSRFHQPKSEQQVLDQPLSGTIEAPIVEEPARSTRIRRPEPPPPKRSCIEFGSRQLPVHPATSTSARQVVAQPDNGKIPWLWDTAANRHLIGRQALNSNMKRCLQPSSCIFDRWRTSA